MVAVGILGTITSPLSVGMDQRRPHAYKLRQKVIKKNRGDHPHGPAQLAFQILSLSGEDFLASTPHVFSLSWNHPQGDRSQAVSI
jgi:hypothetical protein